MGTRISTGGESVLPRAARAPWIHSPHALPDPVALALWVHTGLLSAVGPLLSIAAQAPSCSLSPHLPPGSTWDSPCPSPPTRLQDKTRTTVASLSASLTWGQKAELPTARHPECSTLTASGSLVDCGGGGSSSQQESCSHGGASLSPSPLRHLRARFSLVPESRKPTCFSFLPMLSNLSCPSQECFSL